MNLENRCIILKKFNFGMSYEKKGNEKTQDFLNLPDSEQ